MTDKRAPIPLEALNQHVGVIGKTGSGKSFTIRGVVEQLLSLGLITYPSRGRAGALPVLFAG